MIMQPQGGAPKCPPSAQVRISARVVSGRAAKIIYIKLNTNLYQSNHANIFTVSTPEGVKKLFSSLTSFHTSLQQP